MILLILGILVALAGVTTIILGIPINEFSLGSTLIIAGATALTGGLVLIGLSTVVSELNHLGEALRARPTARPGRTAAEAPEPVAAAPALARSPLRQSPTPPHPRPTPSRRRAPGAGFRALGGSLPARPRPPEPRQPAAPSAVEVSAAAIERLRSSIPRAERGRPEPPSSPSSTSRCSPNGAAPHVSRRAPVAETALEPKAEGVARAGDATATEALKASRPRLPVPPKPVRQAPSESSTRSGPPRPGGQERVAGRRAEI